MHISKIDSKLSNTSFLIYKLFNVCINLKASKLISKQNVTS